VAYDGSHGHSRSDREQHGQNLTYLQWISAAEHYYDASAAQTPSQFVTADYNDWYVATDPAAAGNTGGAGLQEMLAYYTSSTPDGGFGQVPSTPEPAGFLLLARVCWCLDCGAPQIASQSFRTGKSTFQHPV